MAEEKKISFSAVDNGVNTFMKRLQHETKELYSDLASEAKKQGGSQKEQVKYIQDQIKGLERANALEREQSKIILDRQLRKKVIFQREYDEQLGKINSNYANAKFQTNTLHDYNKSSSTGATGNIGSKDEFIKASQAEADKLKAETEGKGKTILSDFAKVAQEQTKNKKEQSKIIHEQISDLQKKLQLEKESLRITLEKKLAEADSDADKKIIKSQIAELNEKSKKDQYLINNMTAQQNEKDRKIPNEARQSIFTEVLKAGLLRDLMGLLRQGAGAQTGLDLVSPFSSIAGGVIGGLAGSAIDAASGAKLLGTGIGQTNAGVIGAQLGKDVSGLAADLVVRHFRTLDQYQQQYLKYNAIGGTETGKNMAGTGFDDIAVAQGMFQTGGAMGTGRGARNASQLMLSLSRMGWSDDSGTLGALGMQRSGGGSGTSNIQKVLALAFSEGLDKAKFSDVIKTQTALMQSFSANKNSVSSDDANRAIFEFNKMGGMFSAGDPRSLSNIQAINNDLASPGTPFGQALNYSVLRRLNPNADAFKLRKLQQQGLQTPGFLKGVIDDVSGMTGDETAQKFMLAGRLPNLSLEAVETLFEKRGKLGSMSKGELSEMLGLQEITEAASGFTSQMMKDQADVSNAFKTGFMDGIVEVERQFVVRMSQAVDEVVDHLKNKFGVPTSNPKPKVPFKNGAQTTW